MRITEVGFSEISYFGHVLSYNGIGADPANSSAIKDMPIPKHRSQHDTSFGLVNYVIKVCTKLGGSHESFA